MRRFVDYNAEARDITNNVCQFTGPDILGDRVIGYVAEFSTGSGAVATCGDISRIRVFAGGKPFVDTSLPHWRAYIARMSRSNYIIADADSVLPIPLYILDGKGDQRYVCQFPKGKKPTVQLTFDGTQDADATVTLGQHYVDEDGKLAMNFLCSGLNIKASQPRARHNITEEGDIRGFGIPHLGLTRIEANFRGVKRVDSTPIIKCGVEALEGLAAFANRTAVEFFKLHGPDRQPGEVYLQTDANWDEDSEMSILSLLEQPK